MSFDVLTPCIDFAVAVGFAQMMQCGSSVALVFECS